MARIKKRGLDYFPISTDFIHDRVVRRLMKREGDAALGILLEVLTYIYSGEGYYVCANRLFYEDLSAGLFERSTDDVERTVRLAVEYGLFDAEQFEKHGILTSAEIQNQYLFSTRRRNVSQLEPAYCLLDDKDVADIQPEEMGKATRKRKKTDEEAVRSTGKNVTLIPENVTPSTHSIAQNTIAEHSVAENRREYPLLNPPPEKTGEEKKTGKQGNEEGSEEGGGDFSQDRRRVQEMVKKTSTDGQPVSGILPLVTNTVESTGKRKEWTQEAIAQLRPPADGVERNYEGLLVNLRFFGIPPSEQYALIRMSDYGAIGGEIWKGFSILRSSGGKIKLPGHYLLSIVNKAKPRI